MPEWNLDPIQKRIKDQAGEREPGCSIRHNMAHILIIDRLDEEDVDEKLCLVLHRLLSEPRKVVSREVH